MRSLIAALSCFLATPLWAGDILVDDAYARASRPGAPTGAMFMAVTNTGDQSDRLIGATTPIAQIVEIHTHLEEDGIMRMRPIEGGIEIPAGATHMLERGGDHVMLMGVTEPLENGETVPLVLIFEKAGEMTLDVVVDNDREQGQKAKTDR